MTATDAAIGRILRWLDGTGQADNTAIVLWSDHGDSIGHKTYWAKNRLDRIITRVPYLIAAPGLRPRDIDTPVSTLTLRATIAELAGTEPVSSGHDSVSAFVDTPSITTYWYDQVSVMTDRHHIIIDGDGSTQTYDYRADPYSRINMSFSGA